MTATTAPEVMAHRCPHHRSLSEAFTGCPAFVAQSYRTIDFQHRPTAPVITCAHLAVGQLPGYKRYFPTCALGSEAERARWVEEVSPQLLAEMRELSAGYRAWVQARMPGLWELKARYLAAVETGDAKAADAVREELESATDQLVAAARAFLAGRSEQLERAGLTVDALDAVIRTATRHFALADRSRGDYQAPPELLDGFPPRLRLFFTAGRPQLD